MTQIMNKQFSDNLDHLFAELTLLDLRLASEIHRVRRPNSEGVGDEFRGLLVPDQQIDEMLSTMPPTPLSQAVQNEPLQDLIALRQQELSDQIESSLRGNQGLRLVSLRHKFGLTDIETNIIILCLAPEIDVKYETLYAYAQDDVGKKRPTLNLALNLFLTSPRTVSPTGSASSSRHP